MSIASPLQWPEGWARWKGSRQSDTAFRSHRNANRELSLSKVVDDLWNELERIGAKEISISMNLTGGSLSSQRKRVADPGVAIYFQRRGQPVAMAQDRFESVAGNARSLTLALQAMRSLERHGGGLIADRAFEGFTGLPAVSGAQKTSQLRWWEVLGVSRAAPLGAIRGAWKQQTSEAQKCGDMDEAQ
ncbi:MAG: hypothetical protein AAFW46_18670, partial [Pseudomonadota bacterium]